MRRTSYVVLSLIAALASTGVNAQAGRTVTGVGQTKPPSRSAAPPATSAPLDAAPASGSDESRKTDDQKQADAIEAIRRGQERQRARDQATDELFARWEFAVCLGCGPSLKPARRVWTNPVRVLAGISASEDDKRQGRLHLRWTSLTVRHHARRVRSASRPRLGHRLATRSLRMHEEASVRGHAPARNG